MEKYTTADEIAHDVATPSKGHEQHHNKEHKTTVQTLVEADLLDARYAQTQRGLKSRYAQMMALGGTIGTGLFLGSGQALAIGGPALLFGAYIFMSVLVFFVVTAIAEVATYLPVHGGTMSYFGFRYVSRSLGFALGYLYWYSLGILVPNEVTAAALVINYWHPGVPIAAWITIMIVVIIALNSLPVKFYGESEFWFAGVKVITLIGLLFLCFTLFWGGGPNQHGILGFHYWKDPGAANTYIVNGNTGRFVAFLKCTVLPLFLPTNALLPQSCQHSPSSSRPNSIVITSGELKAPRHNIRRASRRYFARLIFFYILGSLAIGLICPSNDSRLTNGGAGAGSSPFVVGIKNAGIPVLDSMVNAGVLTSAWSAGNSYLYMSTRSLYSLAVSGNAPRVFKACNRYGLPYNCLIASSCFSALAYLSVSSGASIVFDWFVSLRNTSGFISWTCCIIYFRFLRATKVQRVERTYKSFVQPWGARIGIFGFVFLILINGFTVFFPQEWSVLGFFTAYVGILAFLVLYFGHRLVYRNDPWVLASEDVDLKTGLEEVENSEVPQRIRVTWWKKAMVIVE